MTRLAFAPSVIRGSGGGSKGGGGGATEAPNTLYSTNLAKILDLVSEGPCVGLVNGSQSIFFSGASSNLTGFTPLQNRDGSKNFQGVIWNSGTGTLSQSVIPGFESVSTPVAVSTQVQNLGNPIANAVVRRITDPNANSVRVTLSLAALALADAKSGALNGSSVTIAIDIKPNATSGGAVYSNVVYDTITGKTTSPYQKSYVLELPGSAPWDIRMQRISADDASTLSTSNTYWSLYSIIYNQLLNYPNSALVGLQMDSSLFGTSVPARGYDWDGLIISVPSNYNTLTRTYTGVWDGTFVQAYCNNPSWVLWDLLTNNRYGMGEIIPPAMVSKFDLYAAARYNDTFVPDGVYTAGYVGGVATTQSVTASCASTTNVTIATPGATFDTVTGLAAGDQIVLTAQTAPAENGLWIWHGAATPLTRSTSMNTAGQCLGTVVYVEYGAQWFRHYLKCFSTVATLGTDPITWTGVEPLFTFNAQLTTKEDAYKALTAVAGMMRCNMTWNGGAMNFIQDAPQTPVKVFSPANVIGGKFHYAGVALKAIHTACVVTWSNPVNAFQPEELLVELPQSIARYGYNLINVTAYGCTSIGQATRVAEYVLWTEYLENDSVSFDIGQGEADLKVGQTCFVADPMFTVADYAGRLATINSTTSVTLDRPIHLTAAGSYTLTTIGASGAIYNVAITSPAVDGDYKNITCAALNGADLPIQFAMYAVSSATVVPRSFRVMSLGESQTRGEFKVSAMLSDQTKFSHIEGGPLLIPKKPYSDLTSTSTCSPPSAIAFKYTSTRNMGNVSSAMLSISWTPSTDPNLAGYIVTYQEGFNSTVQTPLQKANGYNLINPALGVCRVLVYAVNFAGVWSQAAVNSFNLSTGSAAGLSLISSIVVVGGGTSWTGKNVHLTWSAQPIYGSGTLNDNGQDPYFKNFRVRLYDSTPTLLATYYAPANNYVVPYDQLVANGLARTYKIGVSTQDVNGNFSNEVITTFSNPAPTLATMTFTPSQNTLIGSYTAPTDADFIGAVVYMSTTNGFTPGSGNLVFQGGGAPTIPMSPGVTYYIRYGYYDAFGLVGITLSSQVTVNSTGSLGGSLTQTNNINHQGFSGAGWTDTAIANFTAIPAVGFWAGVSCFIDTQQIATPFSGGNNGNGGWRIVERQSGHADLVLASGTWSGHFFSGIPQTIFTFTADAGRVQCVNCFDVTAPPAVYTPVGGVANTYTGAVSLVLQMTQTGGFAVADFWVSVTGSWQAAG